jgi:hypothetical protein
VTHWIRTALILSCLFRSPLAAQTSAVQGTVRDATQAVIVGASVTVTNLATGRVSKASTNDQGLYLVPLLFDGNFKVECSASGFATRVLNNVKLEVGQTARLDFELKPGTVTESIEVSASAVLINSETTEMGQVIDSKRILEMPLNGRNYLQLAQFTAGATPGGGIGQGSRARGEGQFSAAGMAMAQNNVLLDGNDNSSRTSGGPLGFEAQAVKPPVDALSEFKVVTNNMSAEYGYRSGAKVLVSTKSGTNDFHGSAYEFLRNEKLDGTNFFANRSGAKKPTYRQNQFGGTFGGPIIRNRTFFFGSYQGTRIRTGQTYISTVPSRNIIERGNFSQEPVQRRNIFDPATQTGTGAAARRLAFPGNIIPASRWDPVTRAVAQLYPASNIAGVSDNAPNNYFFGPSDSDDADQYDFRGDHNINSNHRFFARYSQRDQFRAENGTLPFPATGGQGQTVVLKGYNLASSLSSTLKPTLFNELRYGYSQFDTKFDIPFTENLNKQFGIKNAPGDSFGDGEDYGMTRFSPSGFAEVGARSFWPNTNNLTNWMVSNGTTWMRGKHTIKFGGEFRHLNVFRNASRFRRGQWAFNGNFTTELPNVGSSRANTGNGMADMLLGYVGGGTYGNNQGEDVNSRYYGLFVQDDIRLTSRLTMNAGLRYEVFFYGTFPNADKQSVGRYLLAGFNVPSQADEKFEFPRGDKDCGCDNDLKNWAPRLGFAYQLNQKTVIRTGGGLFYGENNSLSTENGAFRSGAPRHTEIGLLTTPDRTTFFAKDGFPAFSTATVQPNVQVYIFPRFRPTLYAGQWFFDVQRTLPGDLLLTVGYMGTKGTNLATQRNLNLPQTPSANVPANQRRLRPQFNQLTWHENSTNSSYNALTAKAEKRFARGFTLLGTFTWAHNIDQSNEDLFDGGGGAITVWDLSRERSNSNIDRRLAFIMSSVYELPFGKGRSFLTSGPASWIFGGWQIGGIFSAYSGLPRTHSINVNNSNLGGAVRGDYVRNPNLPSGQRSIDRWFDTTFATAAAPGVIDNAGRNLIYAPGRVNLDVSVARDFTMPWEGHRLQFRFESFNFTNTPNFGPPNTTVGAPAAGVINQADDPRRIQMALKYVF